MQILKNTTVKIIHKRKGEFIAKAIDNFDTDTTEWYPVALAQDVPLIGMIDGWDKDDVIPCRASLVRDIQIIALPE